jgi:hypothetical protein
MDYNRDSRKGSSSINEEVRKLLRKGEKITPQDFQKLKASKPEDVVNAVQSAYAEIQGNITKKAKKFAQLIREKYSQTQTPFHLLLEKAHKYKVKYGLSDEEFAEFQRIYEQELVGLKSNEIVQPVTNMTKVLGGISLDYHGFASKLNDNDYKYVQETVKLHAASRPLHAQVLLQSMQYGDCDNEAISGTYDRNLHRPGDHIHPVVVALFLPKFTVVENFFLFSNIAGIVKARFNGEALESLPDYELFYALTTDPNDVVCDNKSPVLDLLNRAQLQSQLWNNVLHLRNGQYYNATFKDFIATVDMCRLNKQDTPDFVYGRYDGVIIKRLVSAFSFRPTVVTISSVFMNPTVLNPYVLNVRPQVTAIPMVNMRLPPSINMNVVPVDLQSALNQTQLFIENGQVVPKETNLIWSRGVLIFYVDRRATQIKLNNQLNAFSVSQLPTPIAGFERLNQRPITFPNTINLRGAFNLRSVVISDVHIDQNGQPTDLVIGSSALVVRKDISKYLMYNPYQPIQNSNALIAGASPVSDIQWGITNDVAGNLLDGFESLSMKRGTIFIYASDSDIVQPVALTI